MNFQPAKPVRTGLFSLPPNQKRRIRLIIHSASAAEIDSFLHDDLQPKTALNPLYFVMLALSALLLAAALLADYYFYWQPCCARLSTPADGVDA